VKWRQWKEVTQLGQSLFARFPVYLKANVSAWSLFCWCSLQISVIRVSFMRFGAWGMWQQCYGWSYRSSVFLSLTLPFMSLLPDMRGLWVGGVFMRSAALLFVNEQQHLLSLSLFCYLSTLLFGPDSQTCVFSSMVSRFHLSLLSASLGPLPHQLSPAFLFKVSLCLFTLSCCVAFLFQ